MKLNCNSFFNGEFDYLNLNEFYLRNREQIQDTKKPEQIQVLLDALNKQTYGGYGEYRGDVWRGTYMDAHKIYTHLGIDINVKYGTEIRCPFDAEIIDVSLDEDTQIGWGGRIILRQCKTLPYLVLAHIDPKSLLIGSDYMNFKTSFKKNEIIGKVGTWPTNGNTFQHLHVQCVYDLSINDFDGYGKPSDLLNNPNPFEVEYET